MEISEKEESILILLKELSTKHENILKMYFGIGGLCKINLEQIGQDLEVTVGDALKIKNDGIREFIRLIISTGVLGEGGKYFSDGFIDAADSDLLDNFMTKFIGSN